MTYVSDVATGVPPYRYSTDEVLEAAAKWLEARPHEAELFSRLSHSTQIGFRHFAVPIEELVRLGGLARRSDVFNGAGSELLTRVIVEALRESELTPADVRSVTFTSCSVPAIPSIDAGVLTRLEFSPSVTRLPIFQHGCAGGAIGLSLASRIAGDGHPALLCSLEFCSLVHQWENVSGSSLVGSAIFGDGAACVVLNGSKRRLKIVATQSYLIPGSTHLMGYDLRDNGLHLKLDREVPACLAHNAPPVIRAFLESLSLTPADVAWWIFHPGGAKILSALEQTFGISADRMRWSWDVLRTYGNMSSASVLFALKQFLSDRQYAPGDRMLMLGVGPGLVLETLLFECIS